MTALASFCPVANGAYLRAVRPVAYQRLVFHRQMGNEARNSQGLLGNLLQHLVVTVTVGSKPDVPVVRSI